MSARTKEECTALLSALYACRGAVVGLLLEHGANVSDRDMYGMTPLLAAACSGDEESVQLLIEHRADVMAKDKHFKMTPE